MSRSAMESPVPILAPSQFDPIEECDKIISGMPHCPAVEFGGNQAFYVPSRDLIQIPVRERFTAAKEFYATIFHELIHSTGHVSRLNRKGITESSIAFGSQTYSREELVAELGALLAAVALDFEAAFAEPGIK